MRDSIASWRWVVTVLVLAIAGGASATEGPPAWSASELSDGGEDEIVDLRQKAREKKREEIEKQADTGRTIGWIMIGTGVAAGVGGVFWMTSGSDSTDEYGYSEANLGSLVGGPMVAGLGLGLAIWGIIKLSATSHLEDMAEVENEGVSWLPDASLAPTVGGFSGGLTWQF